MGTKRLVGNILVAIAFLAFAMVSGYRSIGLPPVVIVGGSGVVALVLWSLTYARRPVPARVILPVFLLTVAALEIHMMEEYLAGFGPAMSRLFDISWTERGFLLVFAFIGPALYALTALGLYYEVPIAGFLAWFIFIGPVGGAAHGGPQGRAHAAPSDQDYASLTDSPMWPLIVGARARFLEQAR